MTDEHINEALELASVDQLVLQLKTRFDSLAVCAHNDPRPQRSESRFISFGPPPMILGLLDLAKCSLMEQLGPAQIFGKLNDKFEDNDE